MTKCTLPKFLFAPGNLRIKRQSVVHRYLIEFHIPIKNITTNTTKNTQENIIVEVPQIKTSFVDMVKYIYESAKKNNISKESYYNLVKMQKDFIISISNSKNKYFIMNVNINLKFNTIIMHAIFLVYDFENKTITYFDPHGVSPLVNKIYSFFNNYLFTDKIELSPINFAYQGNTGDCATRRLYIIMKLLQLSFSSNSKSNMFNKLATYLRENNKLNQQNYISSKENILRNLNYKSFVQTEKHTFYPKLSNNYSALRLNTSRGAYIKKLHSMIKKRSENHHFVLKRNSPKPVIIKIRKTNDNRSYRQQLSNWLKNPENNFLKKDLMLINDDKGRPLIIPTKYEKHMQNIIKWNMLLYNNMKNVDRILAERIGHVNNNNILKKLRSVLYVR